MKKLMAAVLMGLSVSAGAADPAVDKILDCMRANIPNSIQIKQIELITRDKAGGERALKGRLYAVKEEGMLRTMVRVQAPPDLSGAAYLIRETDKTDEIYVYVPALQKVRRISGGSVDGSLWGSDVSYADMKQIQNAFSGGAIKLEGLQKIEGRSVRVVLLTPGKEEGTRYTGVRSWVDEQSCVPLKVEFMENTGVRKRLTVSPKHLSYDGKYWFASEALMEDLTAGTQTRIKTTGVKEDGKVSNTLFNNRTFYLGG